MGSTGAARTGELVVLAGGDEVLLGRCAPVLDILGKKTVHCGEAGKASTIKLAINLYLGLTMTGLTEAVNLARNLGASAELLIGCLQAGPLNSGLIAMKKDALLKGDYTPAFSSANMAKDLNYAVEVAAANDALTPMGEKARDLYEQILAQGLGDKDLSAIDALYRQHQGA